MGRLNVKCTKCDWGTDLLTYSDTNPHHCPVCMENFIDPGVGYILWGNDNETVAVTEKGVFLIQSVDWHNDREPEKISSIPSGMTLLSWDICQDIIIPDSII